MLPINLEVLMYIPYQYGFALINNDGHSYIVPCSKNLRPIMCPRNLSSNVYTDTIITFEPGIYGATVVYDLSIKPEYSTDINLLQHLYPRVIVLTSKESSTTLLEEHFEYCPTNELNKYYCEVINRNTIPKINPVEHLHVFASSKANNY